MVKFSSIHSLGKRTTLKSTQHHPNPPPPNTHHAKVLLTNWTPNLILPKVISYQNHDWVHNPYMIYPRKRPLKTWRHNYQMTRQRFNSLQPFVSTLPSFIRLSWIRIKTLILVGLIWTFSCCGSGLWFSLTSWAQLNWSNVVCLRIKWIWIFKLNPQPILIIQLPSDSGPTCNSKISDTVLVAV